MERRRFLALGAAVGAAGLAGCTLQRATESSQQQGTAIGLEPVVEGITFPTGMAFLPDGSRLVCERFGVVWRHTDDGRGERPILDLRDRMAEISDGERGLLGIELHPDFADNGRFYLRYSAPARDWMPDSYSHTGVLSEFEMTDDLAGVAPDSERIVLENPEPGKVHNAGDLAFGPDGYLYVPFGDGRRTDLGDEGFSWWHEQGGEAQNVEDNLLGGVLRIDPDDPTGDRGYGIPSDNPLVGEAGRDEYYAWGLRNPYRLSFDGDRLFVGDVGEHVRESVYLLEPGDNCGWPIVEGSSCSPPVAIGHTISDNPLNVFNPKTWLSQVNRISPYKVCPTAGETDGSFRRPIVEYQRSGSRAVTGGYVYRGDAIPELQGTYVFGDLIAPAPILAAREPDDRKKPWAIAELPVEGTDSGRLGDFLVSFARDPDGELYVLSTRYAEGSGRVRRIVPAR